MTTKSPWPPVDGGRLLVWQTLLALARAGCQVDLVAPAVEAGAERARIEGQLGAVCKPFLVRARPRAAAVALALSRLRRTPWTVERHRLEPVRREVARRLGAGGQHAVVAEQLQAWPQIASAAARRPVPRLLRAQNVESALWLESARLAGSGLSRRALQGEAERLMEQEGGVVLAADGVAALTARDAAALRELATRRRVAIPGREPSRREAVVEVLTAPFPARLEPGPAPLAGDPPVVLLGSGGWRPNQDQARSFLSRVWPAVLAARPGARLHLFGEADGGHGDEAGREPGVVRHSAPADSGAAMPRGAILVVPVRVASGLRMKILEAWARGIPVVSTPAGAAGLETEAGRELLLAERPEEWAHAVTALSTSPELASRLVGNGRRALVERHDPALIARHWIEWVEERRAAASGV